MKKKKVVLIILAIIVLCLAAAAVWQWNNLQALRYAATFSEEELREKLDENEKAISDILNTMPDMDMSKLSQEAADMFNNGELSESDAIAIITGKLTLEEVKAGKTVSETENSNLKNLIAKIYVLRSTYTGKLDALVAQAYGEYKANGGNINPVADKYIAIASNLEGECDLQIESLLSQIKAELDKTGGNQDIISQIRATYKSEKSIKKGELLSKYAKHKK